MFVCVFYALLCVHSSFAIILKRKRKLIALLYLSYRCIVTISVLLLFLTVTWVGLQCVIVVFPDHTEFSIYDTYNFLPYLLGLFVGLLPLWRLTMQGHYQLRITIKDWDNTTIYATYDYFKIGSPEDMYTLQALAFSGTTGRMGVIRQYINYEINRGYLLF